MNLVSWNQFVEPFVLVLGSGHSGTVIHAVTVQYTWLSMHISIHRLQSGCFGVIQEDSLLDYALGLGYTTRYIRSSISGIIRVMFIPSDIIRVLCCAFSGAHLPRS